MVLNNFVIHKAVEQYAATGVAGLVASLNAAGFVIASTSEIDSLRDECECLRHALIDVASQSEAARADLSAARDAIKDAYLEGWDDAHECGDRAYDWSKSWAKRVFEHLLIDAALAKGG